MKTEYLLNNEFVFKTVFSDSLNAKRLLKDALGIETKKIEVVGECNVDYDNFLNMVYKTDNAYIDIKLNNFYFKNLKMKNYFSFVKMIDDYFPLDPRFFKDDKYIQANFTWNLQKYFDFKVDDTDVIKFGLIETDTMETLTDAFKIVMYNMDYYHSSCYNKRNVMKLIAATSIAEMEIISKGDLELERITNMVKELNRNNTLYKAIHIDDTNLHDKKIEFPKINVEKPGVFAS